MTDDDRVDCNDCRHLALVSALAKLPPLEVSEDPRVSYRTVRGERHVCRQGESPMPGVLRRCDSYRRVA